MNKRTFTIIAKYIAKRYNITIVWGDKGPCADPTTRTLWLTEPKEGEEEEAMALLMHEAGHIGHTNIPKEGVYDNPEEFEIVNACEDIRIDRKNMRLLPNIEGFYEELYRGQKKRFNEKLKKDPNALKAIPLSGRVMMKNIYELEGMSRYKIEDQEAEEFDNKHAIRRDMDMLVDSFEYTNWKQARELVKQIGAKFGIDPSKRPVNQEAGEGEGGDPKQCSGIKQMQPGLGDKFKKGKKVAVGQKPGVGDTVGNLLNMADVAMTEQTMTALKELLSQSNTVKVDQPQVLDTDNLIAFMTEDIDELFYEEEEEKHVRSKVFFLIDGSGSMRTNLLCGTHRSSVVAGCVEQVVKALEEAKLEDSAEVEWEVFGFTCGLKKLDKENWKQQYLRMSGGTNLLWSFEEAQEHMLADKEVDGKKLIVIFTDGDVHNNEVDGIKDHIMKYNEDVRCLIIGVGADSCGKIKEVIGDRNIVAKDLSDVVLAEAIMDML